MTTPLERVREKVAEATPDCQEGCTDCLWWKEHGVMTLEHVLIAIGDKDYRNTKWTLGKPLDDQSEETLTFLDNLLNV